MRDFLGLITKMEPDTRKTIKIGRWRITIDRELNGSVVMWGNGSSPCSFGRPYEAAQHLHAMDKSEKELSKLE